MTLASINPKPCSLQVGGPIGLVKDGDVITIDVEKRAMDVAVSEEEMAERRKTWSAPPLKATRGTLYKVRCRCMHCV